MQSVRAGASIGCVRESATVASPMLLSVRSPRLSRLVGCSAFSTADDEGPSQLGQVFRFNPPSEVCTPQHDQEQGQLLVRVDRSRSFNWLQTQPQTATMSAAAGGPITGPGLQERSLGSSTPVAPAVLGPRLQQRPLAYLMPDTAGAASTGHAMQQRSSAASASAASAGAASADPGGGAAASFWCGVRTPPSAAAARGGAASAAILRRSAAACAPRAPLSTQAAAGGGRALRSACPCRRTAAPCSAVAAHAAKDADGMLQRSGSPGSMDAVREQLQQLNAEVEQLNVKQEQLNTELKAAYAELMTATKAADPNPKVIDLLQKQYDDLEAEKTQLAAEKAQLNERRKALEAKLAGSILAGLEEDVYLTQFFRGLLDADEDDNNIIRLAPGLSWPEFGDEYGTDGVPGTQEDAEERTAPAALYVRTAYRELFGIIKTKRRVLRTPGTGKSTFAWFMLRAAVREDRMVVYRHQSDDVYYLFKDRKVYRGSFRAVQQYLSDVNTWYITDGVEPMELGVTARRVMVSSPSRDKNKSWRKLRPSVLYMPLWEWKELEDCCKLIYAEHVSLERAYALWQLYGGAVRYVLLFPYLSSEAHDETEMDQAVLEARPETVLPALAAPDVIPEKHHRILHMRVVGALYDRFVVQPASDQAALRFMQRAVRASKDFLATFLNSAKGESGWGSLRGLLFEPLAIYAFSKQHSTICRQYEGTLAGNTASLQRDITPIAAEWCDSSIHLFTSTLAACMNEPIVAQRHAALMLRPADPTFATIDAIKLPAPAGPTATPVAMLQVTSRQVDKKRELRRSELAVVLAQLEDAPEYYLYYAVPQAEYDSFEPKLVREFDNTVKDAATMALAQGAVRHATAAWRLAKATKSPQQECIRLQHIADVAAAAVYRLRKQPASKGSLQPPSPPSTPISTLGQAPAAAQPKAPAQKAPSQNLSADSPASPVGGGVAAQSTADASMPPSTVEIAAVPALPAGVTEAEIQQAIVAAARLAQQGIDRLACTWVRVVSLETNHVMAAVASLPDAWLEESLAATTPSSTAVLEEEAADIGVE